MNAQSKKGDTGFTLVELMVVIMIVAILAAVVTSMYRGRIDAAKWSEGKAMIGTIATAIRTWHGEKGSAYAGAFPNTSAELGFAGGDLTGTYFVDADFTFDITSINPLMFAITAQPTTQIEKPATPVSYTLAQDGSWTPGW